MEKFDNAAAEMITNAIEGVNNLLKKVIEEENEQDGISRDDIKKALSSDDDYDECLGCEYYDDCKSLPGCEKEIEDESWDLSLRDIFALSMAANELVDGIEDPVIDVLMADVFDMMTSEGYSIMRKVTEYDR